MKNALIITSIFTEQDSVRSISSNIISAYKKISSLKVAVVDAETTLNIKLKIKYDYIIIAHPTVAMNENLSSFINNEVGEKATLIFYIFGDYVRKSPFYLKLDSCLRGKKVIFYAASECYQRLVKKTLIQPKACLKLPFPINTSTFSYNKTEGDKFRKKFNVKKNDYAILYTGRISPQKNLHLLIKTVKKLNSSEKFRNRLKLFIWGNCDDFETSTFFEEKIIPGQYFQLLTKLLNDDPNIKLIPHANHKELAAAYSGSNLFSSLSLYHDEDFGYAPLEALCTGTPVLITKWGGYQDLSLSTNANLAIHYIDVCFESNFLEISEAKLVKKMAQALTSKRNSFSETKKFKSLYSIATLANQFESNLKKEPLIFEGFHDDFCNLALTLMTPTSISIEKYQYFYNSFWELN